MHIQRYPHWEGADLTSNMWERGPLVCTTDPCGPRVLLNGFFSHITLEVKEVLERHICDPRRDKSSLLISTKEQSLEELIQFIYTIEEPQGHGITFWPNRERDRSRRR